MAAGSAASWGISVERTGQPVTGPRAPLVAVPARWPVRWAVTFAVIRLPRCALVGVKVVRVAPVMAFPSAYHW